MSFLVSACSTSSEGSEVAKLHDLRHSGNRPYIVSMSMEETERLRALFSQETSWTEASCCDCVTNAEEHGYELTLDGICYRICTTEYAEYPISYKKVDGEYEGAIVNTDEEIMLEIFSIINERDSLGSDFEEFLKENQIQSKQASVRFKMLPDLGDETEISEEDTKRLRTLLSLDVGWIQGDLCQCIGKYELILDNIGYMIDLTDVEHQIKVCQIGDNRYIAIEQDDEEIVREVYEIVEKYVE